MALTLTPQVLPSRTTYQDSETVVLSGPSDKIQIKAPAADTLLNEGPASGKTWTVTVNVYIVET